MSLSDLDLETIANNSALIISQDVDQQHLRCHSASKGQATGHWISPSGIPLERPSLETENPLIYSFLDLSFQDAEEEGVHRCITRDENGEDLSLYVGLYKQCKFRDHILFYWHTKGILTWFTWCNLWDYYIY